MGVSLFVGCDRGWRILVKERWRTVSKIHVTFGDFADDVRTMYTEDVTRYEETCIVFHGACREWKHELYT